MCLCSGLGGVVRDSLKKTRQSVIPEGRFAGGHHAGGAGGGAGKVLIVHEVGHYAGHVVSSGGHGGGGYGGGDMVAMEEVMVDMENMVLEEGT
ncbi:hypothetical protein CEXT_298181 [Caerostris extrusa]|uniref:Uncharacterized protein n=1 Tax=Caerostris extrusa TaxID=172846 RepID=A0AAV4QPQ1_CAEEX|nr:hypothetical protein CEXT_298181 [Caerostris extrusa]